MKRVMVVTTGRADYGLLHPLIKEIEKAKDLDIILTVTGSHLSEFHGSSINLIQADNLKVHHQVDLKIESDTEDGISSSISVGIMEFSKIFLKDRPDILVLLGDRYELFCPAISAVIHKIPIAHIHGGESTRGLIDDPVRHSVTKMSALHFTSLDLYRKRVIQMGESPERVFNVGAIGLDNIRNTPLPEIEELNSVTGVDFNKSIALMTYHPVTLDNYNDSQSQIKEILGAVYESDLTAIATMPNTDTGNNKIFKALKEFARQYPEKLKLFKNLGQRVYLGAMKHCSMMIGNSSSGIIESPFFKVPVVNIGDRQGGRFKALNIIDTECRKDEITKAVQLAFSKEFKKEIENMENPYGDGKTAEKIVAILKETDFSDITLIKKGFYDLEPEFI